MMYSKQKAFCNACGKELLVPLPGGMMGGMSGYKVCSPACIREMRWREACSIMGHEYYPDPEPYKE
jgi:hypothetical protein